MTLQYDLDQERQFNYKSLDKSQLVEHITKFVSGLWQIHPFGEGNTRTTAIFTIKYLRSQGFDVNNDLFEQHSWYFRNALVRANYRNVAKGIEYELVFLERFFRNLLLGEDNVLKNRYMMINPPEEWKMPETEQAPEEPPASTQQVPSKHPASWGTVTDNTMKLVETVGFNQMSVKEMLTVLELKDRMNFVELFLNPAVAEGFVRMLYPDKPRHPRQKYLLTAKGITLYNQMMKKD